MKYWFPRKRVILSWHKWLGITSAVFLVVLSITGLALNHTETLKLDAIQIQSKWILQQYGMLDESSLASYRINENYYVSQLDSSIFLNETQVSSGGKIVGTIASDFAFAVVTSNALLLFTTQGELVEVIQTQHLDFDSFLGTGVSSNGRPVFITDKGLFSIDTDWIEISAFEGSFETTSLKPFQPTAIQRASLLESFQGKTISLYRVILDLHSGRLFGCTGRTLMDLTAVAILLLVTSGIGGWLRRSRANTEGRKS